MPRKTLEFIVVCLPVAFLSSWLIFPLTTAGHYIFCLVAGWSIGHQEPLKFLEKGVDKEKEVL